ncbi:MAG: prolipoprotein diacylglyceryl transferase [Oscillospiraceae bacterium]|jgi:phosphatidylglycerol:prolipoprotein diacylglycerol transferase|nr:prolipoprotein diacylglyceryl transferase [Oscillospiraceae bacterium]
MSLFNELNAAASASSGEITYVEFPNLFSGDIPINKVAFRIFGINVYWYGVIITAAVALGVLYSLKRAKKAGVLPDNVFDVAFWGTIGGIIGARAYYVIFWNLNPENEYKYTLSTAITGIRGGGLAIYGGLIGAAFAGLAAAKLLKIKFPPIADLVGMGFLIGHCVGRWGNLVNQEAFGAPTAGNLPWGMTGRPYIAEFIREQQTAGIVADGENVLVHPCFLYESLWCLLGFAILHFYAEKFRSFDGEIFLLYVFWYGAGRAFIEQLRTDSLMAGGLKASQVLAVASAVFALILFVYFKKTLNKASGYTMYKDTEQSRLIIGEFEYRAKLEKEKGRAKRALKRVRRDLEEPSAPSVLGGGETGGSDSGENN